jgi:uncharacterized protein (TIGR00730 family)
MSQTGPIESILVFCASSQAADSAYRDAAAELGHAIALAGRTLVYGGGRKGSMGALADAALAQQGDVIGILPNFMEELEWAHSGLTRLETVVDMQERKRRMTAASDGVVVLPGATGTLEEVFEVITAKRLGLFVGPIVFFNQRGFFDPCIEMLRRCADERFMHQRHLEMWQVVDKVADVIPALDAAPPWPVDALHFASP